MNFELSSQGRRTNNNPDFQKLVVWGASYPLGPPTPLLPLLLHAVPQRSCGSHTFCPGTALTSCVGPGMRWLQECPVIRHTQPGSTWELTSHRSTFHWWGWWVVDNFEVQSMRLFRWSLQDQDWLTIVVNNKEMWPPFHWLPSFPISLSQPLTLILGVISKTKLPECKPLSPTLLWERTRGPQAGV